MTGGVMLRDQFECYQAIGSALATAAKNPWDSIKAEIALKGSQVDAIVSYVEAGSGATDYLTDVPMLARYFYKLARSVSTEEKGLFKRRVFTMERSGHYDAKFAYE
jgi:hypothetical protein